MHQQRSMGIGLCCVIRNIHEPAVPVAGNEPDDSPTGSDVVDDQDEPQDPESAANSPRPLAWISRSMPDRVTRMRDLPNLGMDISESSGEDWSSDCSTEDDRSAEDTARSFERRSVLDNDTPSGWIARLSCGEGTTGCSVPPVHLQSDRR